MEAETQIAADAPQGQRAPAQGDLKAVMDLLQGAQDSAPDTETPEAGSQAEAPPAEKWDLKTVAEKLQVDPSKLYELKVKAGDGHELSIGELKDAWKAKADLDGIEANLTQQRANWQADQIRTQRELEQILSAIDPQQVRPELMQAWEARQKDYLSREREATLRAIPEWSDARKETADKAAILEALKPYGFTSADLENAVDHRLFRMLTDLVKTKAELASLKTKPQPKVAAAPKAGKPATEAQQLGRLKGAVTSGRISPQAAVEKLLRGN